MFLRAIQYTGPHVQRQNSLRKRKENKLKEAVTLLLTFLLLSLFVWLFMEAREEIRQNGLKPIVMEIWNGKETRDGGD